jgi:hypothetical protein
MWAMDFDYKFLVTIALTIIGLFYNRRQVKLMTATASTLDRKWKGIWLKYWPTAITLALLASVWITYFFPYHSGWSEKMDRISNRAYINEEVSLDGRSFTDCEFTNVTLVYEARARFEINHSNFHGTRMLRSHNPTITRAWGVLASLSPELKIPIFGPTGRIPDENNNVMTTPSTGSPTRR